jgi:putative endonuclease
MTGFVYMMSNYPRGVIYIGVTSDLQGRVWEHRNSVNRGFTAKYNAKNLVWFECTRISFWRSNVKSR